MLLHPRQCYRCLFGQQCPAPEQLASYSSVLYCGMDTPDAWRRHADWARNHAVLGVTCYCTRCHHITWMADDSDASFALVRSMEHKQRLLDAINGMQSLCESR